MTYITQIYAREILDSRGMPTVEVDVVLENGNYGRAVAPSGASTGKHEAVEIRDNNPDRFLGKGVLNVIASIHEEIAEAIIGHDAFNQKAIDSLLIELDGTANKSRLGANATLPVSLACAKAAAASLSLPLYRYLGGVQAKRLPLPFMNIINGGSHADNNLSIQEFMIVPIGADQFSDAIRMGAEIFHKLKLAIKEKGYHVSVGDEGGFAPQITTSEQALDLILSAIEAAGYVPGDDVSLALDVAANELLKDDQYLMDGDYKNREQMISFYGDLIDKYPIISIEDPFAENDWESWIEFTSSYGHALQIVGDDLFVTNLDRLQQGIETNAANTILIKPNQVGTLSETLETISVAQFSGIGTMVSHRSGETEDTTIADLTVATNAGQIKTGSLSRSERLCKYNQLLRISEDLGLNALFG